MSIFYVDQGSYRASDGNSGTVLRAPLQTLARANALANSGDVVFVKKGVYREAISMRSDGVTWTGVEPGVVVRGTKTYSGPWTAVGGGVYSMPYVPPPSVEPFIASSGTQLIIPSLDATIDPGEFVYDDVNHLFKINLGGAVPGVVEIAERATFILTVREGCVIEGFELAGSNSYSLRVQGGGGHAIRNNIASYSGSGGIRIEPPSPQLFTPADAGAGSLAAGTYGYIVTAMIGAAETLPSFERVITVASSRSVQLQWSNVPGATGYRIYGRTSGSARLMFTGVLADFPLVAGFPTFTDVGTLTSGATAPPLASGVNVDPCLVEANEVLLINSHGVYLYGASGCTVRGNYCHHNGFHGIGVLNGSNYNLIELNTCHSNARGTSRIANGIQCDNFGAGTLGSSNNVIRRNRCYRNEDSGISVYNGSADCAVTRNVCYANGDHGIDNFDAPRCLMTNNTVLDNVTAGLNSEGNSLGARIYNNISADNGVNSPRTTGNYRVDATVLADAQLDYNLSYLRIPAASQPGATNGEITWGGSAGIYDTLADFRAAVPSQMVHGVSSDPKFIDRSVNDYRIGPSSPAATLGTLLAPAYEERSIEGAPAGQAAGAHAVSSDLPHVAPIDPNALIWLPMFEVYA